MFLLTLFRLLTYFQAPYLFPAFSSILYFVGLGSSWVNLLVGLPISLPHVYTQLRKKEEPLKGFLGLDLLRFLWLLLGWGSGISILVASQTLAMQGFAYGAALMLVLELMEYPPESQVELKYRWYLSWGFWLLVQSLWSPIVAPISLLTHILNFMWEFRITDLY